ILVSDEDRDIRTDHGYESIRDDLLEIGATLNVVVDARYQVGSTFTLGVLDEDEESQLAYLPDGNGGFTTATDPTHYRSYVSTVSDYVMLAWETGGATWDLNLLRYGGPTADSFSAAFVEV